MRSRLKRLRRILGDFLFGMSTFELYRETLHISKSYRDAIYILLLGEFLGIPFVSNYYTLRLLPYLVEDLEKFKREASKEKDLLEMISGVDAH